jgi:K+-sensing histidine kinase KdpD
VSSTLFPLPDSVPRNLIIVVVLCKNHVLFEVLKNSLRAVVETHGVDCENYPPVKVIVAEGNEDITIKISDEGGGIPRSALPLVWTFMWVTSFILGWVIALTTDDDCFPLAP